MEIVTYLPQTQSPLSCVRPANKTNRPETPASNILEFLMRIA